MLYDFKLKYILQLSTLRAKMPAFWDNLSFSRPGQQTHHNLQDGLFQIASQTCSILVKVNNTNNICYENNSTNVHYDFTNSNGSASSHTKVLIPALKKQSYISGYKQRLSVSNTFLYTLRRLH